MIKSWSDYKWQRSKVKHPNLEMDAFLTHLIQANKDVNKAQQELIDNYYNLAYTIALKCVGRGVEFDDLLQSALLGIIHSANKYDYKKSKFSTYATPWIWQHCLRTIENTGRTIRLPNHIHELLIGILREGIDLTFDELANKLNQPIDKIKMAIDGYYTQTLPLEDFEYINYEEKKMFDTLSDDVVEQVLDLFKGDPITMALLADFIGFNDYDEALDHERLAEAYEMKVSEVVDALNRAIEIVRESGLIEDPNADSEV